MREILFRGKKISDGEWIEGDLLRTTIDCVTYSFIFKDNYTYNKKTGDVTANNRSLVDPATVGQYTGLKDKNGKRIFEGDILEHHVQGDIIVNRGVVNWDERNGRWAHQLNTMNPCFYLHNPAAFEVIGNIHDNPELIGGGEDG